jgi:hypothetical protein
MLGHVRWQPTQIVRRVEFSSRRPGIRLSRQPLLPAPTTLLFSNSSTLLQKCLHPIEKTLFSSLYNPLVFYQFRTLLHSSPANPLFTICSPKHTGGIPRSAEVTPKTLLEVCEPNPIPRGTYDPRNRSWRTELLRYKMRVLRYTACAGAPHLPPAEGIAWTNRIFAGNRTRSWRR